MRERFKTFLLISLVGISLVFTKRLWMELPSQTFSIFDSKDEAYSASYLLSDMIIPNKYLLTFNETNHTLFYDDSKHGLWTTARKALTGILGSKDITIEDLPKDEFLKYRGTKSIVFYFPDEVSTYILARALDVKDPNYIVDTIPNVRSIHIYLGKEDSFFVLSNDDKHVALHDKNIDLFEVREQFYSIEAAGNYNYYYSMRDRLNTENNVYVPYEMKNTLPTVYVENEIRNLDEDKKKEMVENFFEKGIDYVREIVESNGSSIYVYDQRVLKFNINGTLEYFHALEKSVTKRNLYESLSTAAEFISKNTGIPKGMYLSKIEDIKIDNSLGYNLTFKYRVRGIPVILGNNEVVDFLEIEVFNDQVRSFKHFIRKDMDKPIENIPTDKKMLTSGDVLDKNYDFFIERYLEERGIDTLKGGEVVLEEFLSSIEDINLSYFDPCLKDIEDKLIGVWVIRTESTLYAFDVYNGSLVYEKKLGV